MKHLVFFKFYFWLTVLIFPIGLWSDVTDGEPLIIIDYFDYLFWGVAITGVFGYCYSKNILNVTFWRVFLPFIILWDLYVIYYFIIDDPEILLGEYSLGFVVFMVLLYLLLTLPEYIAIHLYGHKRNKST